MTLKKEYQFEWVIFCDADQQSGKGHVSRSLTIANELKKKSQQVSFLIRSFKQKYYLDIKKAGFELSDINNIANKKINTCLIDGYNFKKSEIDLIKKKSERTIQIFDHGTKLYDSDFIISIDNSIKSNRVICSGPSYSIIDSKYKNKKYIKKNPKVLLITFGLTDKLNFTYKILENISSRVDLKFKKIYVAANTCEKKICKLKSLVFDNETKIEIKEFKKDFCNIVKTADIVIGSGGVNLLERMCSGIPSMTICTSSNQRKIIEIACKKKATLYLGDQSTFKFSKFEKLLNKIFFDWKLREELSQNGQKLIKTNGSRRLVEKLISL